MPPARSKRLGLAVALVGLALLLLGAWSLAQLRISLSRGPMLISPFGIDARADGTLLVGVEGARIHLYDGDGRFLDAWSVPDAGGRFRLRVVGPDRIDVATETNPRVIELDGEGHVRAERDEPGAFRAFGDERDHRVTTPDGRRYSIEGGGLDRLAPDGALLVPPLRWPLSLFVGRLPWVAVVVGAGTLGLFAGLGLTARRAGDPSATAP